LDSLAEVHRAAQPRLEALLDTDDLRIEFASPGIERTLKSFHEFAIFVGRPVRVLPVDQTDWRTGTIASADGNNCRIALDDGTEGVYEPATVQKARLLD
jgi:ribosome maturation factor RimP